MSKIKVIKTDKDYQESLKLAEELLNCDPEPESAMGEQLDLLTTLIGDYEKKTFPETLPNPVEAIKFRMEQADLKPVDLVAYIGSRSRVSEILSGKRQLTLEMVRVLEAGLGIPAKVLIRKPETEKDLDYRNWDNRLLEEMQSRGYFGDSSLKLYDKIELLNNFFSPVGSPAQIVGMLRKSNHRSSALLDKRALAAWTVYVLKKAKKLKMPETYKQGAIDFGFMLELAKLSVQDNGPILVIEHLRTIGVILLIEPHFNKTYLDGAAALIDKDNPVIGLTLRYDRLDNFWFTLMHELAHLALHYNSGINLFYDEIEGIKTAYLDEKERQADALAQEALLPKAKWDVSPARRTLSFMAANSLADELGVHTAVIAGQIRHKSNSHAYLNKIVNGAKVRKYFPNKKWDK